MLKNIILAALLSVACASYGMQANNVNEVALNVNNLEYLKQYVHLELIKEGCHDGIKEILDNNPIEADLLKELFKICNDPRNIKESLYYSATGDDRSFFLIEYSAGYLYPVYNQVKEYDELIFGLGIDDYMNCAQ